MLPYLSYFILVFILAYLGRNRLFPRLLLYALVISFVGLRKDVGTDYESYANIFLNIDYGFLEPGFTFLINLLKDNSFGVWSMFFICSLLTYSLVFISIERLKKEEVRIFPVAIMISLLTIATTCNGIRQCIAIAFFFFSYRYIRDRQFFKFLACIVLGVLFHFSLLFVLPIYLIGNKSLNKNMYSIIYLLSFSFAFIPFQELIGPFRILLENYERWSHLTEIGQYDNSYFSWGVLLSVLNYSILLIFALKNRIYKKYPLLFNLFFIASVMMNIRIGSPLMIRFQMTFTWFTYIILPLVIKEEKKIICKDLLVLYYIIACSASTIKYIFFDPMSMMCPYKSVLNLL